MIRYERLVAPRERFGLLIEPGPRAIVQSLEEAARSRAGDAELLNRTLAGPRAALRARLGLSGVVVASGHQAEFFHAGVLAKNLAVDAIARRAAGQSVFVSVDSDLPRTSGLRVPAWSAANEHDAGAAVGEARGFEVPIPGCRIDLPTEGQPPRPRSEWLDFFRAVEQARVHARESALPLIVEAIRLYRGESIAYRDVCELARRAVEQQLGVPPERELRISALGATTEFRAFAAHIALRAREFAGAYNEAQREYRRAHRVRNAQHPAPPLAIVDERVEVPFWVVRLGEPRRRMWVRPDGDRLHFFAGEQAISAADPRALADYAAHGRPWTLEQDGWHVRPRALALTAFVRLFVADLFIHGIGGAKYDEMMERFVERFFGVRPAPACCVSATLYPRVPVELLSPNDVRNARAAARDARHNPQRHAAGLPAELLGERTRWIDECVRLRRKDRLNRAARAEARRRIRAANAALLASVPLVERLEARAAAVAERWETTAVARDRELFFGLHALSDLAKLNELVRGAFVRPE